jgi:beta-lactam-binding protein with PASTA domain
MSGQPLPPSARDPAAGETNPRREEVRGLGLRGGSWRYLSLAVGIVVVIAVALWFGLRSTPATMPDLKNMTFAEALGAISDSGAACLDTVRVSDAGDAGVVVDQQPPAGTELPKGPFPKGVTLTLGSGTNRAAIEAAAQDAPATAICGAVGDGSGLFEPSP